jgi:hypothetical protein
VLELKEVDMPEDILGKAFEKRRLERAVKKPSVEKIDEEDEDEVEEEVAEEEMAEEILTFPRKEIGDVGIGDEIEIKYTAKVNAITDGEVQLSVISKEVV